MKTENSYKQAADLVMSKLLSVRGDGDIHDHMTLDTWEWPQGVALYAMMKIYRASHDQSTLDSIIAWYEKMLKKGLPTKNINTCAPMLCMTFLYEETGDERYLKEITEWAKWVVTGLPRTQEGGFQHVTSDDFNAQQIWDDTLFMTVLFLYRAGLLLGNKEYTEEAKYQFLLHIKYLQSQQDHLWYHGYCFDGGHHFADAYWARGNSWFTCGAVDFVEWLSEDDAVRRIILNTWISKCEALAACQDQESGLWHTLLDDPTSYTETSGSAAIVYGIMKGLRLGLLDKKTFESVARKGFDGVLGQIAEDGTVLGVSYGTPMGHEKEFYKQVAVCPTAYGQGLTFLMLTECLV